MEEVMNMFIIATAARLAAENYTGKPCVVDNRSAKRGVAYEIATAAIGEGTSRVALVYMDGRIEWHVAGYVPRDFDERMTDAMCDLLPVAKRVAASW